MGYLIIYEMTYLEDFTDDPCLHVHDSSCLHCERELKTWYSTGPGNSDKYTGGMHSYPCVEVSQDEALAENGVPLPYLL